MKASSSVRRCATAALAMALFGTAATASAQQTVVVAGDNDRHVSHGPNAYLFRSGLIMTAVAYTPALVVAINSDRSEDKYLYAPVVGPWMDLGARDGGSKGEKALLVVDGVFQTVGAIQILASFLFPGSRDTAKNASSTSVASRTIVAPARLSSDSYGLVALGHF